VLKGENVSVLLRWRDPRKNGRFFHYVLQGSVRHSLDFIAQNNSWHHDPFRGAIAAQLVRYDHAGPNPRGSQQLAEEPHGRESITPGLDEDVDHNTVLINGSPEIVCDAVYLEEDFIQCHLSLSEDAFFSRVRRTRGPNLSHQRRTVS
jgi:hypothetical protein